MAEKKSLDFPDLKNIARPHPFLSLSDEGMRSYFGEKQREAFGTLVSNEHSILFGNRKHAIGHILRKDFFHIISRDTIQCGHAGK